MKEPKIIPEHLDNPINYKFVFTMIVGITAFHYFVNSMQDRDVSELVLSILSIINPTITAIMALLISLHYKSKNLGLSNRRFRDSYLAFAFAFTLAAGGEFLYFIYDYALDEPAFPSPADILFVPFYPLVLVYLYLSTSFYKSEFNVRHVLVIILPIIVIVFYLNLMWGQERDFQFFLSFYYIVVSSISLAFTIYGTLIFKDSVLGKTWLLLLLGIMPFAVADVVYYNLEAVEGYDLAHPVNLLWYVGYWIITYALYKHPSNNIKNWKVSNNSNFSR